MSPPVLSLYKLVLLAALGAALTLAQPSAATKDFCARIAPTIRAGGVVSASAAVACLDLYKFNPANAAVTLKIVEQTIDEYYVYRDYLIKSPDAAHQGPGVDLRRGLAAIRATKWRREREFHTAIYELLNSAHDAKLAYFNNCFRTFTYYHAFPLVTYVAARNQVVVAVSAYGGLSQEDAASNLDTDYYQKVVAATEKALGVKVSAYAGARVLAIDGQDPVAYLRGQVAARFGGVRDLSTRYNLAMAHYQYDDNGVASATNGYFAYRQVAPPADFINITLQRVGVAKAETLRVPFWAVYQGFSYGIDPAYGNFTNSLDFYSLNCARKCGGFCKRRLLASAVAVSAGGVTTTGASRAAAEQSKPAAVGAAEAEEEKAAVAGGTRRSLAVRHVEAYNVPLLYSGFGLKAFALGPKTAVVVIHTFGGVFASDFQKAFVAAFTLLKTKGYTRVLLDLSDSSARADPVYEGDVKSAYGPVDFLFPPNTTAAKSFSFSALPLVFKASKPAQQFVNAGVQLKRDSPWFYGNYASKDDAPFRNNPKGFFYPVKNVTINGARDAYSSPAKDGTNKFLTSKPNLQGASLFNAKNVLILSNGNCLGGCALFALDLIQRYGVRSATLGGAKYNPQPFNRVGAGDALLSEDIANYLLALSLPDSLAPPKFPTLAYLRVTFKGTFGLKNGFYPADFVYQPPTYHVLYTVSNVFNKTQQWLDTAKLF